MELFLMTLALALIGVVVSGVLFAAAAGVNDPGATVTLRAPARVAAPARFFVDRATAPPVPIDVVLLQIEQHVRLEQAAAEAFLHAPTRQSLHSRTMSPLVH